ncbi:MAG: hydrogenase formation protein HypD [Elusimicrobia bacterium]|jgi:hydrogenase expression/formation protein HypD|nr:hydrogenase formation protein HypD [Elusimicrobiota bacterium]MBK7208683.1 hydrogenase formation protein HypD [Elusimicrobiota bacterium]MBK7545426.1 hydrogenase formation protein HypD [Elusimicrobiota bacterium]MBK7575558.1 hydrogenase formation protein HypD [Elusimicrobiota bacterium]MBK7688468.1 hydrogenase formation protein HypD [Elusimicrobiota bacterium]
MKFVDEYRDPALVHQLADRIGREARPGRSYRFMEFCGGHTHTIHRFGLSELLPPSIKLVHGPGCPVCVLPAGRIQAAVRLAVGERVVVCSYGDVLRAPAADGESLLSARARGADARVIYAAADAMAMAAREPSRPFVFFAAGFETTVPATAWVLLEARRRGLANFSVYCNHVLTPPALHNILDSPAVRAHGGRPSLDGFIGPSHVSAIIGTRPYDYFAREFQKPVVVAGFEPVDVMTSVLWLVRQINEGRYEVENEYSRAVVRDGNLPAQRMAAEVFELRKIFEWRGLGPVPYGGLRIRRAFREWDAEARFDLAAPAVPEPPGCLCGAILRGMGEPLECPLFGTACTPERPVGSCMVSSEGACAALYRHSPRRPVR